MIVFIYVFYMPKARNGVVEVACLSPQTTCFQIFTHAIVWVSFLIQHVSCLARIKAFPMP